MPEYKINFFFSHGPTGSGWSETYYVARASPENALTVAVNLAGLRAPLLGFNSQLNQIRVSDDDIQGDSLVNPAPPYALLDITQPSDTPWQTALLRLSAGALTRRQLALRGIPDSVYNPETDGDKAFRTRWFQYLNATFIPALIKDFDIKGIDKTAHSNTPILSFAQAVQGYTVTLANVPTVGGMPAVGSKYRIYNMRSEPRLAGAFLVTATNAGPGPVTVTLLTPPNIPLPVYNGKAYGRVLFTSYQSITFGTFVRVSSHRVGRFFGAPVGRRRRRVVQPR